MPEESPPPTNPSGPGKFQRQFAVAMELPFILVGAVLFGGFAGYLVDRYFKTAPYGMFILGILGFFVGVRELLRQLSFGGKDGNSSARK